MWAPNCIAVKCGTSRNKKDSFLNIYTSYNHLAREKVVARCVEYYYKGPTDWLTIVEWLGYVILRGLRMFIRL